MMRRFPVSVTIVFSAVWAAFGVSFRPPSAKERLDAIGSTDGLASALRKAFDPAEHFEPIPSPQPGDWLAVHREEGQTFAHFARSRSNHPDKTCWRIYLQPIGKFKEDQNRLIKNVTEYARLCFVMNVEILPTLALADRNITTRIDPFTKNRQILTTDVLAILKENLPPDAFCVIAVTMEDLYPDPSWNFVFGQASLRERVGVYSFVRYDPAFYGQDRRKNNEKLMLRRSCKVLAHESAHMFGLTHCTYFKCLLNGSNHLEESDSRPMHLCPVCLRKLHHSIGFDVVSRYAHLFQLYRAFGFEGEALWIAGRLEWMLGTEAAQEVLKQISTKENHQ